MNKKKKKKPYYPNNWLAIASAPPEFFDPIPFDIFFQPLESCTNNVKKNSGDLDC